MGTTRGWPHIYMNVSHPHFTSNTTHNEVCRFHPAPSRVTICPSDAFSFLKISLAAYAEPNSVPGNNSFVAGFIQCMSYIFLALHPSLCSSKHISINSLPNPPSDYWCLLLASTLTPFSSTSANVGDTTPNTCVVTRFLLNC